MKNTSTALRALATSVAACVAIASVARAAGDLGGPPAPSTQVSPPDLNAIWGVPGFQ